MGSNPTRLTTHNACSEARERNGWSLIVYMADQDTNDVHELYSVPITGGTPVQLNSSLFPAGGDVGLFKIAPDSTRVVYRADHALDETYELWSVPLTGGAPSRVSTIPVLNGDVQLTFLIAPDSSRVVYLADEDIDEVVELYSNSLTGSAHAKLNANLSGSKDVKSFGLSISPDSSRVVYLADQNFNDVREVFSVPIDGSAPAVALNGPLTSGGDVDTVLISADSSTVVYRADQLVNDRDDMFARAIDGSGIPVRLNHDLDPGGKVVTSAISPDSSRVVYVAMDTAIGPSQLWSVPIGGGTPVKINGTLVPGGNVDFGTSRPMISPDSTRVVYLADQETDTVNELFSVPIGGGPTVKLNGLLPTGGTVMGSYLISPNSKRVVYLATQETNDVVELWSAPLDGSAPATKLSSIQAPGGDVDFFSAAISADSHRVIYLADQDINDVNELYSAPIVGGPVTKLNLTPISGGNVQSANISADSRIVVYLADLLVDDQVELFWATLQQFSYGAVTYRSSAGPGS